LNQDVTNRTMIIGGALLLMFVALVIVMLAWGAPDESIDRLSDLAGYMGDHNNQAAKLIITFGGIIVLLLAAVVIIFEVSPPDTGSVKVLKVGTGDARIGTDEIAEQVSQAVRAMPEVNDAMVSVSAQGDRADISLQLHVGAQADLSAVADEACRRARTLVEGQMGVELVRPPRARLHYKELRVGGPPQPASAAPVSENTSAQPAGTAFTGWERLPPGPTAPAAAPPTTSPPPPAPPFEPPEQKSSDETTQAPS
jgi:hypothetical protein